MRRLHFSKDRVAEARDLRALWYNGEKVERTPFAFTVKPQHACFYAPGNPYTHREMCGDSGKAVDGMICAMQYQFDTFPDCDYLPVMLPFYLGEGILAALYGAGQHLVDDNPPFTSSRPFTDIVDAMRLSNGFGIEDTH